MCIKATEAKRLTCLQPRGVVVEEIEVDQVQKPSWEIKGGCHKSPDLKQTDETRVRQKCRKTSTQRRLFTDPDFQGHACNTHEVSCGL